MGSAGRGGSWRDGLRAEVDLRPAAGWVVRHQVGLIVALGVVLRVSLYLHNRGLWMDEIMLARNLVRRTSAGLFAPMIGTQIVPPGFLLVEWAAAQVPGGGALALRLFPLLSGLAALAGFAALAGRCLPPRAAWVALMLFAVSGDLIYYSSELKPYQTDVAAAVACTLGGLGAASGVATPRRWLGLAALGAGAVWLSFPASLVLAGVGTSLIASALARGERRQALALALAALTWAASFAAAYALALHLLGPGGRHGMRLFWAFAFPPWPPTSWRDAAWPAARFVYLFANPLGFGPPVWPAAAAVPAAALWALGAASLWRRDRRLCAVLATPALFAIAAAYLRLYPFHGRLVLFLVPSLLLVTAEGALRFAGFFRSRAARAAVLAALLLPPTLWAAQVLFEPQATADHNRFGDLGRLDLDPTRFPF
jgi:hypothetical protein